MTYSLIISKIRSILKVTDKLVISNIRSIFKVTDKHDMRNIRSIFKLATFLFSSNLMLVIVLLCVVSLHVASPKPHSRTRKSADGEKEDCYNITKDKMLNYQILNLTLVKSKDGCKPLCENNNKCSTFRVHKPLTSEDRTFFCVLYEKPYIFATEDINLEECKKKCRAMKECKTLDNYKTKTH
ncbi:hypothetical protein LOTGIDRAFT_171608 [Lottia gigantea]|uniref:Apple domain-containing protein n=1 Tax=Lottia gigantea TaxID=225164 RepID=V4B6V1_LOTGI|nr:hypothetical protein LOTGIDRAFT_171608 [Lottia gigantea]ESP03261.1 hypothetical protein LOTGIDRAFT_171608 [Lottia gigantea]